MCCGESCISTSTLFANRLSTALHTIKLFHFMIKVSISGDSLLPCIPETCNIFMQYYRSGFVSIVMCGVKCTIISGDKSYFSGLINTISVAWQSDNIEVKQTKEHCNLACVS